MRRALLPTILLLALPLQPALAGDVKVIGGGAFSLRPGGNPDKHDDLYAYVEADFSHFYIGVSGDVYNAAYNDEIDPYIGFTYTTANDLTIDLSYSRNIYPNDGGDCCATVKLSLSTPLTDKLTGSLDLGHYTEDGSSDVYLTMDYDLNDKITLTGSVGATTVPGYGNSSDLELAASYALGKDTAIKAHYFDGTDYPGYLRLDLTWDTTFFGG